MRFALLGNHPDGLEMAAALVQTGRHEIAAYTATIPEALLGNLGSAARAVRDLEEILSDPAIGAVIVAGSPVNRPAQLRRALQSERDVLCVWPPDATPETAYEAAMIRDDTGRVLLPLLPAALHPAFARLATFTQGPGKNGEHGSPLGAFRLLEVERTAVAEILLNVEAGSGKPSFPGWEVLRRLGGEITEVFAFAADEELTPGEPILLSGRFERSGLFQVTLLPGQPGPRWRYAVIGDRGRAELLFPQGGNGPAFLDWRDESGALHEESWERWDPWPILVEIFEASVMDNRAEPSSSSTLHAPRSTQQLSWQDAIRGLELDDAARRSVGRRRASLLEYPEASEEVGFKGTMTLVGCGILWGSLLLLVLSRWVPYLGWAIVPLLIVFLGLQLLRYVVPDRRGPS
jgi:predicted dehydrogenase